MGMLCSIQGLTEEERLEVSKLVDQQIQDNLGMAMIYTLVDLLKDWLVNQVLQNCSTKISYRLCTLWSSLASKQM